MSFNPKPGIPVSKVELRLQCRDLLNLDLTSKSDPCAVLIVQENGKYREFGRTENIKNSLNPQFAKSFEIDYYFEEVQNVRVEVYDLDNKTPSLSDDDFLGAIDCTLGQIVSGVILDTPLKLRNGKNAGQGKISVSAEEVDGVNDILNLSFKANDLDKKDLLSKSDPYLEFLRKKPGTQQWQVVYRTEVVKNNLNPVWKKMSIKAQKLCAGDVNSTIQVNCYDYDNDGSHDFIGTFETSCAQIMEAQDREVTWQCINPKKQAKKKSYKNSGTITLTRCEISKEYSFLEFIFGGTQINFTVGIDFTASNGDPRNPQSLHYNQHSEPNEYIKAMQAVGDVIQDYDSDKMFPALGFGARIPPDYKASHEFALNFNLQNPFCPGIDGIIHQYKACLNQIQLYGPTNFTPVINHVARFGQVASNEKQAMNYFVLLILTDGVITDMNQTREAIVRASHLPMSIIIIGVGEATFTDMDILDGDEGVLKAPDGTPAVRDIVQFVPFREFKHSPLELAKHVLAEIPRQVTDYFKLRGIAPTQRSSEYPTSAAVAQ